MEHSRATFLHKLRRLLEAREFDGTHFVRLAGGGILLRQLDMTDGDIDALASLVAREKDYLRLWLDEYSWRELLDARRYIDTSLVYQDGTGSFDAGIWYQNQLAGIVSVHRGDGKRRQNVAVGYWLGREYQGKGIATQSVMAVVDYAFEERGFGDVRICTAVGNTRSRAVAERLRFMLERIEPKAEKINGNIVDNVVYMMIREVWRGRI